MIEVNGFSVAARVDIHTYLGDMIYKSIYNTNRGVANDKMVNHLSEAFPFEQYHFIDGHYI